MIEIALLPVTFSWNCVFISQRPVIWIKIFINTVIFIKKRQTHVINHFICNLYLIGLIIYDHSVNLTYNPTILLRFKENQNFCQILIVQIKGFYCMISFFVICLFYSPYTYTRSIIGELNLF